MECSTPNIVFKISAISIECRFRDLSIFLDSKFWDVGALLRPLLLVHESTPTLDHSCLLPCSHDFDRTSKHQRGNHLVSTLCSEFNPWPFVSILDLVLG